MKELTRNISMNEKKAWLTSFSRKFSYVLVKWVLRFVGKDFAMQQGIEIAKEYEKYREYMGSIRLLERENDLLRDSAVHYARAYRDMRERWLAGKYAKKDGS